jgi:hypothetical protein
MSQSENKQFMLAASKRVLERPFVALGKPLVALNVRHQFRYAIEYLVREGYPCESPPQRCEFPFFLFFINFFQIFSFLLIF